MSSAAILAPLSTVELLVIIIIDVMSPHIKVIIGWKRDFLFAKARVLDKGIVGLQDNC